MNEDSPHDATPPEGVSQRWVTDAPRIYHYTSVEAARQILSAGMLWLSAGSTMNDGTEGEWLKQRLLAIDVRRLIVRGASDAEDAANHRRTLYRYAFEQTVKAYLACFSSSWDSLSQWRAYADDGQGVALGFDPNHGRFPVIDTEAVVNLQLSGAPVLRRVQYVEDPDLEPLVERIEEIVTESKPGDQPSEKIARYLADLRWSMKNPAFVEEQEWRVISLALEVPTVDGDETWGGLGERRFRTSGSRLISFYEMPYQPESLRTLVIGPRCALDEYELGLLLKSKDMGHVAVHRSQATYRR